MLVKYEIRYCFKKRCPGVATLQVITLPVSPVPRETLGVPRGTLFRHSGDRSASLTQPERGLALLGGEPRISFSCGARLALILTVYLKRLSPGAVQGVVV